MRHAIRVIQALIVLTCVIPTVPGASDLGWPRQYSDGNAKLTLYQPQVDSWVDFKKLDARFAASLSVSKHAQAVWGVLSIHFETKVDRDTRTVNLGNFTVTGIRYSSARDETQAKEWQALTIKLLPTQSIPIALDRLLAYMDESKWHARETAVLFDPPPILVSTQPAVLVIIDGDPIRLDIGTTRLQKIVNTNWDLFFDEQSSRYYLRDDQSWLTAKALNDSWVPVTQFPAEFSRLPASDLYRDVRQSSKPSKTAASKRVLVVNQPSELIVLAGNPVLAPIAGTRLMWVANTECDLFFDAAARQFYFLTSGRWFRAWELKSNAWTAAMLPLPPDFAKIPADHPRAHVLASVRQTRQAEQAVLSASIPQISTIARKAVKADVGYAGDPNFLPIANTGVEYAVNTPKDVLRVADRFYLCQGGTWLLSTNARGPWQAADSIPKEIYSIPPSSSKHHVTYVTVAGSDGDSVVYRSSAGYDGAYVANGVVVWGTGYAYPPYVGGTASSPVYWPPAYYTYGASTWYNPTAGAFFRGSTRYGPYGGYARAAGYDPVSLQYSRGKPALGPYGPRYRVTPALPALSAFQTSAGKAGRADVYASADGNVYQRDSSGQWSLYNVSSWASAGGGENAVRDALNYASAARKWGNYNTQRAESADKLGGWTGDPFVGRGISGWMMRSPGFGGKSK